MKTRLFIILAIVFIIASCSSWKSTLVSEGDVNDAVRNAITDFMHTCYLHKKDSIFSVIVYMNNDSIIGLSLLGHSENKIYPGANPVKIVGIYSYILPSQYLISKKKLFYWDDSTKLISWEVFDVLKRYNHIDSTNLDSLGILLPYIVREYAKGADYYFCKNDLRIYKKVVTHIGMGGYESPKLKCNKCKNKSR